MIEICRGYSKDHRPDLKQAVLQLICSQASSIPIWLEALSGNSQDKTSFAAPVQAYIKQLQEGDPPCLVMDSAWYTQDNLKQAGDQIGWISRVPETLTAAQRLEEQVEREQMEPLQKGYWGMEVGAWYGGVKQRWVVVFSEAAFQRQEESFSRRLQRAGEKARKQWKKLRAQEWRSVEEAHAAVARQQKDWRYHRVEYELEVVAHYDQAGRPRADQEPDWIGWQLQGEIVEDEAVVARARRRLGKFVLASNELEEHALAVAQILEVYKAQGASVERGFRFLKAPFFFAAALFLKKPERVMALMMVMGLALLVYALAERKLRQALQEQGETLPDQTGTLTQRITLRRVFQVFEGVDIVVFAGRRCVVNLRPIHHQILRLMGPQAQRCYLLVPADTSAPDGATPTPSEAVPVIASIDDG